MPTLLARLNRRSNFGAILPLLLAGAAAVILSMYVLFVAARESDSIVREQQQGLITKVLAKQLPEMTRNQKSVAIWDDAVENTRQHLDPDWLDSNLGVWLHDFYGIDQAYVLNERDAPVYAMVDGKRADAGTFAGIAAAVEPLVGKLRASAPYPATVGDEPPHAAGLVTVGGRPAMASVMPLLSDTGKITQDQGSEYVHVALRFVDGPFLTDALRDYALKDARFDWHDRQKASEAAAPLATAGGSPFGYAIWTPFRPGLTLLTRTAPALLGSTLVLCGVIALLAMRLMRSSAEARHLALHDPLSNLANRALFNQTLDQALTGRKADDCIALLYMDLDRFKDVNDTLGHPAGDELIRELALRLSSLATGQGCVARLGGDEFAMVVVESRANFDAPRICRAVIDAVAKPFHLYGNQAFIGVSIGVAVAPKDGDSREDIMRKADLALYRAKRQGRNRFMFFEPGWDYSEQQRRQIEQEVRRGVAPSTSSLKPLLLSS